MKTCTHGVLQSEKGTDDGKTRRGTAQHNNRAADSPGTRTGSCWTVTLATLYGVKPIAPCGSNFRRNEVRFP